MSAIAYLPLLTPALCRDRYAKPTWTSIVTGPDAAWRQTVDDRIDTVRGELKANTELTAQTNEQLQAFIRRAEPTLEVTEPMLRGAAIMGRFVGFVHVWGVRIGKVTLFCVGVWAAIKVVSTGGGWAEAVRAFVGVQK